METTLYPCNVLNTRGISSLYSYNSMMKKEICLNLDDQSSILKPNLRDAEGILNSPDLGLLKLATPDLERLIIQSNGMVTTIPTSQFLYPKSASDEQEFAEGFVKALEDLHKQNQLSEGTCVPPDRLDLISSNAAPIGLPSDLPVYTTLNGYERKKLRNRIAASKCRKRKLERISRLEDKVKNLKTQNTELASTASVLREQVAQLKQKVMNHVSNGCQLLPNQDQAY
ncbi:unnamed protein product [Oncorhynchus mykiss]|uniref:Transcription factor JunD n=1 Tax=Oncorhynchus mykiss TaxID=8022 RepID=A0A060XFJ7_ONCMY|nr:unnamed protein product [Oncorhynchus mykiss]